MESVRIEEEQVKHLKQLWEKYSQKLITAALICLSIYLAWQYYQHHQQNKIAKASVVYDLVLNAAVDESNSAETINMHTKILMENYPNTIYSSLAVLFKAKNEVENNKLDDAVKSLDWVLSHKKYSVIYDIAKIRKARVLLVQKNYQQALNTIEQAETNNFKEEFAILRGDIYYADGKLKQAGKSYQKALTLLKKDSPKRMIVRMKLSNVS